MSNIFKYSKKEELWNIITHGIGLFLAIIGSIILIIDASINKTVWHIVSFSIYSFSLILLYSASTLYHSWPAESPKKYKLNVFDHSAIYILIAGTYTPFVLVTLRGLWGWSVFGVIWGLAIAGIILKFFYIGRFKVLSTLFYVLMGCLIIIAIKPLLENLEPKGLNLLLLGGISYCLGAAFYLFRNIPYNHAIFHVFVLVGSLLHFLSIYFYV